MNQTTCFYFIKVTHNDKYNTDTISTKVSVPDYLYKQDINGNELNLELMVDRAKDEIKKDELVEILLDRDAANKINLLPKETIVLRNVPCELVIVHSAKTDKDYKGVLVHFSDDHQKLYFMSKSNIRSLKHRNLKAEFEKREDITVPDDVEEAEEKDVE